MKKIDPPRYLYVCFWILIFTFVVMIGLFMLWMIVALIIGDWENASLALGVSFLILVFVFPLMVLFDYKINHIWIEGDTVKQISFFKRRYKECKIRDITLVVSFFIYREGEYIALINEFLPKDQIKPQKYIYFKKTKRNLEFLNSFWHGRIEKL